MTRARHVARLAAATLRAISWLPLLAAGALGLVLLLLGEPTITRLRLVAVALCAGTAFALDDPAAETLASSPTTLLVRRLVRVALVLPVVAALWALLVAAGGQPADAALALELAALLAVALTATAVAARFAPDGRGALAAAPALLVLLAAAAIALPDRWTLLAWGPADPHWAGAHGRWALVLVLALLALLQVSRDPARRRLLRAV